MILFVKGDGAVMVASSTGFGWMFEIQGYYHVPLKSRLGTQSWLNDFNA
jgi:hypothetical protein